MHKLCLGCKKNFLCKLSKTKFCSHVCYWKSISVDVGKIERLKIIGFKKGNIPPYKGKPNPYVTGENNFNWKSDDVGYAALHQWIKKRKEKPYNCTSCGVNRAIDLANISGRYKRELDDWEYLCRKCHMIKDGRLKKFIKSGNPTGRKHNEITIKKMSNSRKKYWENHNKEINK